MTEQTKQNMRGIAILVPLIIIAVALMLVARSSHKQRHLAEHSDITVQLCDTTPPVYRSFDPNTADYRTMLDAGISRNIAVSLIKWREAGKVFRIKEDLALCYGMTDSLYFAIEPYIVIGEEYRLTPNKYGIAPHNNIARTRTQRIIEYQPFRLDTATAEYLSTIGFSMRQSEVIVRYRDIIGGYGSLREFAECYVVGDSIAEILKPYIIFDPEPESIFPIEINSADSATLRRVYGIGERSVVEIIRYREELGGYYRVEQLSELDVIKEHNFEHILQQIYCDSTKIKKININFASPKALEAHPYITSRALRRIVNKRQLKGGWSTVEELIEDNIFSEEEAKHIAPYLSFGTNSE